MAKPEVKPKFQFNIRLNKQAWVVKLYTKANFNKKWPGDVGICRYDHKTNKYRELCFAGPTVSADTVAHELWHAYMSYKEYSHLTPAKLEEAVCELIGKKYKTLNNLTDKIFNILTYPNAYTNIVSRRE